MIFNKIDEEGNISEDTKIFYIYPIDEETDNQNNHKNLIEIKRLILKNYLKNLISENRFWKFKLIEDNSNIEVFYWSEYLQKNKLSFNDIYANMQKEGLIIKEQEVIIFFNKINIC